MKQSVVVVATWCVLFGVLGGVQAQSEPSAESAAETLAETLAEALNSKRAELINQVRSHPTAAEGTKNATVVDLYAADTFEKMDQYYAVFEQRVASEALADVRNAALAAIREMEHLSAEDKIDYLQRVNDLQKTEPIITLQEEAALKGKNGWATEEGCRYFYVAGVPQRGWIHHQNQRYYVKEPGSVLTGWLNLAGTWYYLNPGGDMAVGWKELSGKWYYLKEDGTMAKSWIQLNGT